MRRYDMSLFEKKTKNYTKIDWCDRTINPVVGCTKGCFYCYAKRIADRNMFRCPQCTEFKPHSHLSRLRKILPGQKPQRIFINSMWDWNDPFVKDYWRLRIIEKMTECKNHQFLILSKRPEGYTNNKFPDNVWLGATSEGRDITNTVAMLSASNKKKQHQFISLEPLLKDPFRAGHNWLESIDWLIVGAMTGPKASVHQPKLEWIERCMSYAEKHKVPIFLKNNLTELLKIGFYKIEAWQEFPEGLDW